MAAGMPVPAAALTRAATAQAKLSTAIARQQHHRRRVQHRDAADQAQRRCQVGRGQAKQQHAERRRRATDGRRVDQHRRQLVVQPRREECPQRDSHEARGGQQQSGAEQEAGGKARRCHDRGAAISGQGEPG